MLVWKGDGAASEYVADVSNFLHVALLVVERRPEWNPGRPREQTPNFRCLKNPGFIHRSCREVMSAVATAGSRGPRPLCGRRSLNLRRSQRCIGAGWAGSEAREQSQTSTGLWPGSDFDHAAEGVNRAHGGTEHHCLKCATPLPGGLHRPTLPSSAAWYAAPRSFPQKLWTKLGVGW